MKRVIILLTYLMFSFVSYCKVDLLSFYFGKDSINYVYTGEGLDSEMTIKYFRHENKVKTLRTMGEEVVKGQILIKRNQDLVYYSINPDFKTAFPLSYYEDSENLITENGYRNKIISIDTSLLVMGVLYKNLLLIESTTLQDTPVKILIYFKRNIGLFCTIFEGRFIEKILI